MTDEFQTFMNKHCKKSCGLCAGQCKDIDSRCPRWVKYCTVERFENYMKKTCKKSCKVC